jgi:hypothetical protein
MAGLASATADAILNALLNSVTWSEPAAVWIKLHTGDPGTAGTNNAATETTRKQAFFTTPSFGYSETSADLDWVNVSTTETYTHWSAWSASSGGTFLFSDQFDTPIAMTAGGDFSVLTGDIWFELTPTV